MDIAVPELAVTLLTGEINLRITQEMNGLMDNFTAQIRRAFIEAINATQELSWLREQNESPKVALDGVLDVVIELSPSLIQILVMIWMKHITIGVR